MRSIAHSAKFTRCDGATKSLPSPTRRGGRPRHAYAAQEPVPLGRNGPESASPTMLSGTPRPLGGPLPVAAAKTVVRTAPDASTTGPPELPLLTEPRNEVISRWIGPRPYESWLITVWVVPRRAGATVNGPFSGYPSTAAEVPDDALVARLSGGKSSPATRRIARSFLGS